MATLPHQPSGNARETAGKLLASSAEGSLCVGMATSPHQLSGDATGTAGKLTASLAKKDVNGVINRQVDSLRGI